MIAGARATSAPDAVRRMLDPDLNRSANEPWYVSSRASQQDRYARALRLIRRHVPRPALAADIGCAEGVFTRRLAGQADRVLAVDCRGARLSGLRAESGDAGNIETREGDFPRMTPPAGGCDLLTALEVLYYFEDGRREEFIDRCHAWLRPGGWLLVSANVFRGAPFTVASLRETVRRRFRIVAEDAIHRRFYYRMELPLIRWLDEIRYLEDLRVFSPNILRLDRAFYPGRWNRILLRPSRAMDRWILPAARRSILRVLRSRVLYRTVVGLSRGCCPGRSLSQWLILARRGPE